MEVNVLLSGDTIMQQPKAYVFSLAPGTVTGYVLGLFILQP